MVDISERLSTPEQAIELFSLGVIQYSQHAWTKEGDNWILCFDNKSGGDIPQVVDWSTDKNTYAAFDLTDLGIMFRSLGFFLSGSSYQPPGLPEDQSINFWADDIASTCNHEEKNYKAYGRTETEARTNLLIYLIKQGKVPLSWPFFKKERLDAVTSALKTYGLKPNTDLD
jgi:hypothetical protein